MILLIMILFKYKSSTNFLKGRVDRCYYVITFEYVMGSNIL